MAVRFVGDQSIQFETTVRNRLHRAAYVDTRLLHTGGRLVWQFHQDDQLAFEKTNGGQIDPGPTTGGQIRESRAVLVLLVQFVQVRGEAIRTVEYPLGKKNVFPCGDSHLGQPIVQVVEVTIEVYRWSKRCMAGRQSFLPGLPIFL